MRQGMILDVDGTLVLSNDAHARAWVEAFAEFGYDVPFERVRPLIGMGGDKLVPALMPGLSKEEGDGKRVSDRRAEIFRERYRPTLQPALGARSLVEELRRRGLKVVVASSARRDELDMLLEAAQVADLIHETTTSSDAEESKPAPDIVGVALDKLGLEASSVVMLGDTPFDIEAASGCGVATIAVRCGGFTDDDLRGAAAIYDHPADVLEHLDSSPLAVEQTA